MKNEMAKDIVRAEGKIRYDAQCKKVLANKTILAWILKYTAEEFRDMEIPAIRDCIEGEPEISSVRVEPGDTNRGKENRGEKITGEANEDKVPDEGSVYFDIRFSALLPGRIGERVKLIINVEGQNDFYPGYDIVTRGIFYTARLISSQLETEFTGSNYGDIKKVYSIWICLNSPKKIGNAISKFSIKKEDLIPGIPDNPSGYDKITVVQVCLNRECKEHEEIESELTGMLNLLFDPTVGAEKKIKKLEEDYHMEMENRFGRELNQMCNFSDYVEELGIQKGMRDGKILNAIGLIQKKIRKSKSLQEIADELEEQVEDIESIYLLVKENPDKTENEILQMLVQKGNINERAVDGGTTESN